MSQTPHEERFTHGQLSTWRSNDAIPLELQPQWHLARVWTVPPGTSDEAVDVAIAALVARHDSLRTVVGQDPDGGLTQVVHPSIDAPIGRRTAEPTLDGAYERARELAAGPIDLRHDVPWRLEVQVAPGGAPTHVAVAFHHFGSDQWGLRVLERQFAAHLAGVDVATGWQPRQIAAWQHHPDRRSHDERTQDYWVRLAAAYPGASDAGMSFGRTATRLRGQLGSPALRRSLETLSAATQVTLADLVLALVLDAHPALRDELTEPLVLMTSNRSDSRWRDAVTTLNQATVIDLPARSDEPFAAYVGRVRSASRIAQIYGSYDFDLFTEVMTRERGAPLSYDYFYNFAATAEHSSPAGIAGLTSGSSPRVEVGPSPQESGPRLEVRVVDRDGLSIDIHCDETLLDRAQVEALLGSLHDRVAELAGSAT